MLGAVVHAVTVLILAPVLVIVAGAAVIVFAQELTRE